MRRAATAAWQVLRKAKPVVTPAFAAAGAAAFFQSSAYAHSPPPSSYAPGPAVAAEEEYEEGVPKVRSCLRFVTIFAYCSDCSMVELHSTVLNTGERFPRLPVYYFMTLRNLHPPSSHDIHTVIICRVKMCLGTAWTSPFLAFQHLGLTYRRCRRRWALEDPHIW